MFGQARFTPARFTEYQQPQSASYRGRKSQHCPKRLGEGARGVWTSWRKGLPRVSCTSATLFCTSSTGFWSIYTKTTYASSPNDFGRLLWQTLGVARLPLNQELVTFRIFSIREHGREEARRGGDKGVGFLMVEICFLGEGKLPLRGVTWSRKRML